MGPAIIAGAVGLAVGTGIGIGGHIAYSNYKAKKEKQKYIDEFDDLNVVNKNIDVNIS